MAEAAHRHTAVDDRAGNHRTRVRVRRRVDAHLEHAPFLGEQNRELVLLCEEVKQPEEPV